MVKGTAAKSSAIASREFLDDESVLFNGCDQTAFRCSGSGCRDGDSLTENDRGDFVHGLTEAEGGGVMITRSSYKQVISGSVGGASHVLTHRKITLSGVQSAICRRRQKLASTFCSWRSLV